MLIRQAVRARATPEQAWALLSDLARHSEWNPHLVTTEVYGTGVPGVGTRYRVTYELSGRRSEFDAEVVEFTPTRRFAARLEERVKDDGRNLRRFVVESYDVTRAGSGIHVIHDVRIEFSGIPFLLRVLVWFILRTGHPMGQTTMEKFGQILEAEVGQAAGTAARA